MSMPSLRRLAGALSLTTTVLAAVLAPTAASAAVLPSFSDVVIFGDSLSDTGNTQALFGGFVPDPSQPYYGGRFSNGKIWTEFLAAGLGQAGDAKSFAKGGNNYAYAGARTGPLAAPIPDVLYQTQNIWGATHAAADANALYVVVAGGNDMRDARSLASGNTDLEKAYRQVAADAAVANLKSSLGLLASRGAKNVLLSNLPDLGATPEAMFLELVAGDVTPGVSSDATNRFNALLPGLVSFGTSLGLNVSFLDMAGVAAAVRNDALFNGGAVYGLTNALAPCAGFTGSNGASCDVSLFSDALHPSSAAHKLIADAAFAALGVSPVPEAQTVLMMLVGLVVVGASARRLRRD